MGIKTVLDTHAFFQGFTPAQIILLTECASSQTYAQGHYIFKRNEAANHFHIILKGMVSLELHDNIKGQMQLMTLKPGELLGWSWLDPPYVWEFDARTVKSTETLMFNAACLRAKMDESPALGYELLKRFTAILAKRLQATRMQLMDFYGQS